MSLFDRVTNQQMTVQEIQKDPIGFAKQSGFNIPDNLAGNPQGMVMHLIQTGQVGGQRLQQVMPMIQRLMGK